MNRAEQISLWANVVNIAPTNLFRYASLRGDSCRDMYIALHEIYVFVNYIHVNTIMYKQAEIFAVIVFYMFFFSFAVEYFFFCEYRTGYLYLSKTAQAAVSRLVLLSGCPKQCRWLVKSQISYFTYRA